MQSCWSSSVSSRLVLSKLGTRRYSPKDITLGTRSYQSSTTHNHSVSSTKFDRWSSSELLVSSVVSIMVASAFIASGSKDSITACSISTTSSWRSSSSSHFLRYERPIIDPENESPKASEAVSSPNKHSFEVSVSAMQGGRLYMEDDFIVRDGGRFAGVFDGHGGSDVSRYLRTHLYSYFRQAWKRLQSEIRSSSNSALVASALRMALDRVEHDVLRNDALESQGSTAVAVAIQENKDGSRTLVSANLGDSRAVLCRNFTAVDLTRDHKPSDERERLRIENLGENIIWDDYGKVYRVHGLSLSRAVGDRFAKPIVSGDVEIQVFPLTNDDEFIVLASDGLWDVMGSEYVVNFIKQKLEAVNPNESHNPDTERNINIQRLREVRRKNMSRYVACEALKKGSEDNICVIIIWLKPINDD